MAEGSFLNWYVNPEMPEEAIRDFEELGKGENCPSAGSGQGIEKQKHHCWRNCWTRTSCT